MEEDTKPDVKPDIQIFFLEENPDIKNLQENPKKGYVNRSDNNRHLKSEESSENLASKDILASMVKGQKFDGIEDIKCEVSDEDSTCLGSSQMHNEHLASPLKLQGQVDSFGGIEHLKPEPSEESFDDMTDEKPCIATLKASVAAYSVNEGREEMELEPFSNTEMPSQEMLEPLYSTASYARETDQESVDNCPSDARTGDCKEMAIKKRVEHSDKGKSSGCPMTLNEFSQDAEQKKITTIEVSPLHLEILHRETSTGGPFQCFWCPWVYFQFVDCERHMKRFHREEYVKLSQEKNSQHVKTFHQSNGLHPCRMSSSSQSGKSLQTAHHRPSEVRCHARGERTFIKTETPVDLDQLLQNEHARKTVVSNDLSKQVPKRFCSMQKSKDNKECSKLISANKNNASSLFSNGSRHKRAHTDETLYKSCVCGKGFRNSGHLYVHKRTHTVETPYMCDVCGKGFEKSGHLSVNKKTHSGKTPYKCDVCGKGFGYSSSLSIHMRSHTGETPYKCDVCSKEFRYGSSLSLHKRYHTGETPYKCDVCGKGFIYIRTLTVHMRFHTGETPYKCDVCGKGFGYSSKLSEHMRSHTGETPYKCDVCGMGFGYNSSLSVHKRSHTGETPYQCDVCGKRFGYNSSLSVHKRSHTGETPYKCDVCGKGFGHSGNLSMHKIIHTGEIPYKCDVCGKGFRHSKSLSRHKKKTHLAV